MPDLANNALMVTGAGCSVVGAQNSVRSSSGQAKRKGHDHLHPHKVGCWWRRATERRSEACSTAPSSHDHTPYHRRFTVEGENPSLKLRQTSPALERPSRPIPHAADTAHQSPRLIARGTSLAIWRRSSTRRSARGLRVSSTLRKIVLRAEPYRDAWTVTSSPASWSFRPESERSMEVAKESLGLVPGPGHHRMDRGHESGLPRREHGHVGASAVALTRLGPRPRLPEMQGTGRVSNPGKRIGKSNPSTTLGRAGRFPGRDARPKKSRSTGPRTVRDFPALPTAAADLDPHQTSPLD